MDCPKCGAADLVSGSSVCSYCGSMISPPQRAPAPVQSQFEKGLITSMVFCRGCGKEIHETAATCPSCGASQSDPKPQPSTSAVPNNKLESISDSWKMKFYLLEKAGGVKLQNVKNLPFGERVKVVFNFWAFLFGPFYYLAKGMWKKAISLFGVSVLIIVILAAICEAMGISDAITSFVASAIFATRANIDFYKKVKLGDNGWW